MNIGNISVGPIVSAVVAAVVVACGGGGSSGSHAPGPVNTVPPATFSVSGNVTDATVTTVVRLNGGSDQQVAAPSGAFTFTNVPDETVFNIQAANSSDKCTVSDSGVGKLNAADVSGVTVSCSTPAGTDTVVRTGRLSGVQENPVIASTGTGTGGLVLVPNPNDPSSPFIFGGVTLFNITTSDVRLFQNGDNTPIVQLGTAGDGHTFFIPKDTTLTGPQAAALSAGALFFDVFTTAHQFSPGAPPTGEIRGQLDLQGGVLSGAASMDFNQEVVDPADVNCTSSAATGRGTVIVDRATRRTLIAYMTHDVPAASAAQIHTSPSGPGSNGDIIVGFNLGPTLDYYFTADPADPNAPSMTTANISDFLASRLYFNIHSSPKCPNGEIRGNITPIQ